jgi:hypothetical protein
METTLIRAIETLSVLAAVLTLGAGLGGIVGYLAMRKADRTRGKVKAHDRLHTEPVAMIDTQSAIRRAVQSDRSDRSRKSWQTRRQRDARRAQQDADIRVLIGSDEGAR